MFMKFIVLRYFSVTKFISCFLRFTREEALQFHVYEVHCSQVLLCCLQVFKTSGLSFLWYYRLLNAPCNLAIHVFQVDMAMEDEDTDEPPSGLQGRNTDETVAPAVGDDTPVGMPRFYIFHTKYFNFLSFKSL